jgi:hypothetical protein
MQRYVLVIALIFFGSQLAALAQVTEARTNSGAFLYHSCQLRLKAIDDPHFKPTPHEIADALMCDSYIQGFTDGMISNSHEFCALPVTREQAIRKYISFMTENSYFLKEDKLAGVAMVLRPLYRCPQSQH